MFEMAKNSMILFARGKLFKDVRSVILRSLLGMMVTAALFLLLALGLDLTLWASAGLAAFLGGALQPYLFKNLKYA